MSRFHIHGGRSLHGTVRVGGSKNAALPIIASSLLMEGPATLENVPRIADIEIMLRLIEGLGKTTRFDGSRLRIEGRLEHETPDRTLTRRLRASLLLMGPLLAKMGRVTLAYPGGCYIGHRPINAHLEALHDLGATVEESDDYLQLEAHDGLHGTDITLPELSVTGTENALLGSVLARGETVIRLAATEPHVQDLARFLVASGAAIEGIGANTLRVAGVDQLSPPETYTVIPDGIEAGTFAVAAAATNSEVTIEPVDCEYLEIFFKKLGEVSVHYELDRKEQRLRIKKSSGLRATTEFKTGPHPHFPTDLQAPWAVLMTQAVGTSMIHDPMFEGRQAYIEELKRMGADATVLDPHRALVSGPTPLFGTNVNSLDLRAGATLIIAGLVAEGETVINKVETIDRGYEGIDKKLRALGAEIIRQG